MEETQTLENNHREDLNSWEYEEKGTTFTVDFKAMTQKNGSDGKVSKLRRYCNE